MMQRFWSWLAVSLARHAGIVTAIGLVFTVVIGFGITRIDFATGQDSYLNADSQVYKDNVAYQDIFGGEAMLTGIAMTNGEQIDSIFTRDGIQQLRDVETGLREIDGVKGVISPLTALEFSASLVQSADGNPLNSIASRALSDAEEVAEQAGDTASLEARQTDFGETAERLLAIPTDQQTLDNPEWVKFLLYDNEGEVRKALGPSSPTRRTRRSSRGSRATSRSRSRGWRPTACSQSPTTSTSRAPTPSRPVPRSCSRASTTTSRGACSPSAESRSR